MIISSGCGEYISLNQIHTIYVNISKNIFLNINQGAWYVGLDIYMTIY